jgi:hypothetical protein
VEDVPCGGERPKALSLEGWRRGGEGWEEGDGRGEAALEGFELLKGRAEWCASVGSGLDGDALLRGGGCPRAMRARFAICSFPGLIFPNGFICVTCGDSMVGAI